jgi:heat shock protein HslJ
MKNSLIKNILLSMSTIAIMVSCSSYTGSKSKIGGAQINISNTSWILADQVKGNVPTLIVEKEKINGNAGCNNYFGKLTLDPTSGIFVAQNVASSRMLCIDMSVEDNFLKMLQKVNKYVVSGNTLELYQDNLLLLKFNKKE